MKTSNCRGYAIRVLVLGFLLTGIQSKGYGQQKNILHANQQWIQYYNELKFSEKWSLHTDGSVRWQNGFKTISENLLRVEIGYWVSTSLRVSVGIAQLSLLDTSDIPISEIRPHQEINIAQNFGDLILQHRFRVEQRMFNTDHNKRAFNFRFRYRFVLSYPIIIFSADDPERKFTVDVGNEIFINNGREIVYNMFDRNRLFLGSTFQFNDNFSLSLTYHRQFSSRNSPTNYEMVDLLWLELRHVIFLYK